MRGDCCRQCVSGPVPPTTIAPTTTVKTCASGEYMCNKSSECIPLEWLCDGERDCYDADDERLCNTTGECFDAIGKYDMYKKIAQLFEQLCVTFPPRKNYI